MSVTEEVFRLRYEAVGQQQMAAAQATLKRLANESAFAEAMFKVGATSVKEYTAALGRMEQQAKRAQTVIKKWGPHGGGIGGIGGGGSDRGALLGRTGFALANLTQDIAQGGGAAGINNLLQPMLWDDLAKAIGGGRLALAGFGTAAVAVGAGFIAVDRGLKQANLGWGDFLGVVGNLAPVEAAGQAVEGFGMILKESGIVDFVDTFVGDVAQYSVGWRDATEAVRQHKQVLAETAANQQAMAAASAKFRSEQQKANDATGERFGQALAEMGGAGGLDAIKVKIGKGGQGLMADAIGGKAQAQKTLVNMLGQMGMDTGGLEAAMLGPGMGIDEVVAQVKAENDLFAKENVGVGIDEVVAQVKAENDLFEEERKRSGSKAIADVPFAPEKVMAGLNQRLGQGMGADQAAAEVAQGLVTAIGDAIPEADAQEAAKAFVDEQLKALKGGAAAEKLSSPYAMTMRQLDLQQSALGLRGGAMDAFSQGPRTMEAGSFAQSVQDSQKPLIDTIREGLGLQQRQIEHLQKIADNTRMNTLVGP